MRISLNDGWKLHPTLMMRTRSDLARVKRETEDWYDCSLPCDVHMPLIEYGVIKDPALADYSPKNLWIERRAWWFVKNFEFQDDPADYDALELVLESIDTQSDIFFNDVWIGSHANVHRPFVKDVGELLIRGTNEIVVRVTTGLETVRDLDLAEINWAEVHDYDHLHLRHDKRRAFVRRPQYNVGWDWCPRSVSCGIVGSAELRCSKKIVIREVKTTVRSIGNPAIVDVMANVENLDIFGTKEAKLSFEISFAGNICVKTQLDRQLLTSGYNYLQFQVEIADPKIWWPNGYGEQPLYDVSCSVECEGHQTKYPSYRMGIRTVSLDLSLMGDGEDRWFTWVINGQRIFCKGGNWVPTDCVYARVSDHKYETLIKEAVEANFNILRIWGGGLYEKEIFYRLCDQYGILVWHDFMFACCTYPDHLSTFREEVRLEMDYQTKRLRNHACLGFWCGNNENHEIFHPDTRHGNWTIPYARERQFGLYMNNVISKEVIRSNCPEIPYWNSSPYGGKTPISPEIGDNHFWEKTMQSKDLRDRTEPRQYDGVTQKFISEYGYLGPCSMESTLEYFDGAPLQRSGPVWDLHYNTFDHRQDTVPFGIARHYGKDPEKLSMEEYIRYGGAVHSLMLGYSLEAIRFKDFCSGAIFWMYTDTWGEVGWTIVDYYLRRKAAYYAVKRAFDQQKVIMRVVDDQVVIQLSNDKREPLDVNAQYGYVSFDGTIRDLRPLKLTAEPVSRRYILREPLPEYDYSVGTLVVIPEHSVQPAALRMMDYNQLKTTVSKVNVDSCYQEGNHVRICVSSETFAHSVMITGAERFSDNYFDLLPGESREVVAYNTKVSEIQVSSL